MAITFKDVKGGQTTVNGASQALTAFAVNPAAGDLVVVFMASFFGSNPTHTAPTDSAGGNTYTEIGTRQRFGAVVEHSMWFSKLTNGAASFVVTGHQTNGTMGMVAILLTGNDTTTPYNSDSAFQNTTSTNPTSGTSSPAPPTGSIFLGGVCDNLGSAAETDGSGWNTTGVNGCTAAMVTAMRQTNNATSQAIYTEYKMANVATAAIWTAASTLYIARVASFQPLAAAGSLLPPFPPAQQTVWRM